MGSFVKSAGAGLSGIMDVYGANQKKRTDKSNLNWQKQQSAQARTDLETGYQRAADQYGQYSALAPEYLALARSAFSGQPVTYTDAQGDTKTASYNVTESPFYKWQQQQLMQGLNRSLASRGLLGGGQGATAQTNVLSALGSRETDNQWNRLANMLNLAQYGSTGMANAALGQGQNLANTGLGYNRIISNVYDSLGDSRANIWSKAAKWNYQGASDMGDGVNQAISLYGGGGM